MKKETSDFENHLYPHTRRNGTVVMVTAKHHKRLYRRGDTPPRYPVPAIPLRAVWGTDYMWDTVYLERPCENDPVIVSVCDMNFDRCLDFGTPWCEFYRP